MRSAAAITLTLALALGVASVTQAAIDASGGGGAASRIIDRTFSCSVTRQAGARVLTVTAVSGFRDPDKPADWKWQPGAALGDRDGSLVSFAAGVPNQNAREQRVRMLAINPASCRPASGRLALSPRGLVGGRASQLQGSDTYECRVAGNVLVRVRAVFRAATTLSSDRYFGRRILAVPTSAVVREARLAVRAPAGRPLVYADVLESGRARLFTARGCIAA
jgi:hypothetical protein